MTANPGESCANGSTDGSERRYSGSSPHVTIPAASERARAKCRSPFIGSTTRSSSGVAAYSACALCTAAPRRTPGSIAGSIAW